MQEQMIYEYDYEKSELTEEFLEHHGIKGQKWGVENGPPYPLNKAGKAKFKERNLGQKPTGKAQDKPKSKHEQRVEARKKKKLYKQRVESVNKARAAKDAKRAEATAKKEAEEKAVRDEENRKAAEELNKKQLEAYKEQVKANADIRSAYQNSNLFTTEEINQILNKYEANQKLSALVNPPAEKKDFYETAQKIQKYADVTQKTISSLKSIYNAYEGYQESKRARLEGATEKQKKAQEEAIAKAREDKRNNILSNRNIGEAYKNRNLFSKEEIEKLMSTVETDDKLREMVVKRNPQSLMTITSTNKTNNGVDPKKRKNKNNIYTFKK